MTKEQINQIWEAVLTPEEKIDWAGSRYANEQLSHDKMGTYEAFKAGAEMQKEFDIKLKEDEIIKLKAEIAERNETIKFMRL